MANFDLHPIWRDIKAYRRVYVLTAIASFGGMLFGWDTGLIGGVLTMDAFQHSFDLDKNSPHFSSLQGNIVSVLQQAGCFFGALSSFYVSDKLGRKWALIIADIIFILGSLIQTLCAINTTSLTQLYVGRVIGGFGVGLISAVVPTYIGENANKEIRGRCIGCMQLFNVTGICLSFFVNYGMNIQIKDLNSAKWRVPFALQMLPGVLLLAGIVFQNESPRWLVEKNRLRDAAKALATVRGKAVDDATVVQELDEIVTDFQGHEKLSLRAQLKAACSNKRMFYQSSFAVILMFWQQMTGTNSINYYAPQIFQSVGLKGTSSGLFATGVYGIVKIVVTALGLMFATEQMGRKWSLLIGSAGQAFAMFYIGVNQAVNPTKAGDSLTGNSIFAIICVYLFVVFYSFGWGPIPFVLSSECSPNHVRSLIMAAALMTQWLFNFIIAKITPLMLDDITYGTFLLFGSCCILMGIYTVLCVPETKNVPLESMHLLFEGSIIKGCVRDMIPRYTRAKKLQDHHATHEADSDDGEPGAGRKGANTGASHIEDA
ncbi:MFS quinate transporter-like protein QutD [Massariosphaeria phaeospora]|uniref:MFS quinate transporter-like protein QutD n=1 Tax=Massariosphaeria phaeospora TaxID=100035 RepID=A0A7C8M2K9_9PLEO|nr:MFS quinate transporter-like protein QutD [Massariosphaeria phaeospora]